MSILLKLVITALVSSAVFIYFRGKNDDGCPLCLAFNAAIATALLIFYILSH